MSNSNIYRQIPCKQRLQRQKTHILFKGEGSYVWYHYEEINLFTHLSQLEILNCAAYHVFYRVSRNYPESLCICGGNKIYMQFVLFCNRFGNHTFPNMAMATQRALQHTELKFYRYMSHSYIIFLRCEDGENITKFFLTIVYTSLYMYVFVIK